MRTVNIHAAKTHLSKLVEEAAKGESFIIAKAGKPMVKVIPLESREEIAKRRIGFMKGEIVIPEDFDEMMADEIQKMFEGEDEEG